MGLGSGLGLGLRRQQRAAAGEVEAQCACRAHKALHVGVHVLVRGEAWVGKTPAWPASQNRSAC